MPAGGAVAQKSSRSTNKREDAGANPAGFEIGPVRLPDGPVLVLTPPESPQERRGVHLAVTTPDRLRRYWRALPNWCWRADAVTARAEAYASGQPQADSDLAVLRSGAVTVHDLHLHEAGADPGLTDQAGRLPAALRPEPRYELVAEVRATPLPSFFRRLRVLYQARRDAARTTEDGE